MRTRLAGIVIVAAVLAGCGSGSSTDEKIQQAKKDAAAQQRIKDRQGEASRRQAKLEAEIERLKREGGGGSAKKGGTDGSSGGTTTTPTPAPAPVPVSSGSACSDGLSVGANTSCSFAENVRGLWRVAGGGSRTIIVHSPVTGQDYSMSCTAGAPTVCRGGNNAVVYIR